jgi:AcrR family transcriptional regulator
MTARAPSLRERQRAQVLGEIQRSALRLFAERGYDAVTTEEIATAAGVSLSTYFRHVDSKDELLLGPMRRAGHVIVANLRDRPADEPPDTALTRAITAWSETFAEANDAVAQWRDVILRAPHLLRRITLIAADDRERMVELVAERMGTDRAADQRPGLLVHVLFAATEYAYQRWLVEGTDWTSLHEFTCQALDVTRSARWQ